MNTGSTSTDLAVALAIYSSYKGRSASKRLVAAGEVGLTGEIRSVSAMNQRLTEVARLGFTRCVIPAKVKGELKTPKGLELIAVHNVREAMDAVL